MTDKLIDWNREKGEMRSRLSKKYSLHKLSSIEGAYMTNNDLKSVSKMMGGENKNALFDFFSNFSDGAKIVVLGSGGNTLVSELEEKYPKLNFVSLDLSYFLVQKKIDKLSLQNSQESKEIAKSQSMLSADWQDLPFADKSVDGLFSHFSFPYWGKNFKKTMSEIFRVSKDGAKWFFDGADQEDEFKQTLHDQGWDLQTFWSKEVDMDGTRYFVGQAIKVGSGLDPSLI